MIWNSIFSQISEEPKRSKIFIFKTVSTTQDWVVSNNINANLEEIHEIIPFSRLINYEILIAYD